MAKEERFYSVRNLYHEQVPGTNRSNYLAPELWPNDGLTIKLWYGEGFGGKNPTIFRGSLADLFELVLLGQTYKAQLQAEANTKKLKLCDLCGQPTTGRNPHYDCEQREKYLADECSS